MRPLHFYEQLKNKINTFSGLWFEPKDNLCNGARFNPLCEKTKNISLDLRFIWRGIGIRSTAIVTEGQSRAV